MRKPKLQPPDTHYLSAAVGWFELGSPKDAEEEVNRISAAGRQHPDVLEFLWVLAAEKKDWDACLEIARAIIRQDSKRSSGWIHQAYALRRVSGGGLKAAWDVLLSALALFPRNVTILYNLACYACQMGKLDTARQWLAHARKVSSKDRIKSMALADSDLEPLWTEIREW
jgi:tetratricopeptide (TPR) repeat protein